MNKSDLITIRSYVPTDEAFIYATWLRGLYHSDTWYSYIKKDVFMNQYHKVIENILSNPQTIINIACLKEDPNVILGYAVQSNYHKIVHFVFVKSAWRKIGLAKMLIPELPEAVTHITKAGLALMAKFKIEFNPFLI